MTPFAYADDSEANVNGAERDTQEADARARRAMPGTGGGEPTAEDLDAAADKHTEATKPAWIKFIHVPKDTAYTTVPSSRRWLLRDLRNDREGVVPTGKLGLVAAIGGGGKTQILTQLGEAVALGQPWLGTFDTGGGGKVLMVLGEEDDDEVDRRAYKSHVLFPTGTTPPPNGFLVTLPLVGRPGAYTLIEKKTGTPSKFCAELRAYIKDRGPFALVILDPLARFASGEVERDNDLATAFIMACESLIPAGSDTAVILAHHVSQTGSAQGLDLDVSATRGVTGLVNAGRWTMLLGSKQGERQDGRTVGLLRLHLGKSNYSRRMAPLDLMFTDTGAIVLLSEDTHAEVKTQADKTAAKKTEAKSEIKAAATSAEFSKIGESITAVLTNNPGLGRGELDDAVTVHARRRKTTVAAVITAWKVEGKIIVGPKDGKKEPHSLRPTRTTASTATSEASPPPTNGLSAGGLDATFAGAS